LESAPRITRYSYDALDRLTSIVHAELHRIARRYMRNERPGNTLQTTALVNEVYLRLVNVPNIDWQHRAQFFGLTAQLMRRILVDAARAGYGDAVPASAEAWAALGAFLIERVEYVLEQRGAPVRNVRAVTRNRALSDIRPRDLERNLRELAGFAETDSFRKLAAAFKRVRNIARELPAAPPEGDGAWRRALKEPAEVALVQALDDRRAAIEGATSAGGGFKAAYTAARAEQLIEQAQDADADLQDDPGWPAVEAAGWLDEITGQIQRELGQDAAAEDLMELRPGAPADSGIRILFAVEPPGTALLIAVLDGSDAVRDHYREAVLLASGVLRGARTGPLDQAAEPGARTFADAPSFLEEFFPGRADELSAGAAALVAANRARTLAEQRIRLGLTQAQVAARMGVRQERVSAIERAEPGATEIRTLAGYVEALGGRLDIVADFGAERILLR
jgi:hypothetical protein